MGGKQSGVCRDLGLAEGEPFPGGGARVDPSDEG